MTNATADAPVRANKAAQKAKASPCPAVMPLKPAALAPAQAAPQPKKDGLTADEQLVATTLRQQLMAIYGANHADLHADSSELLHAAADALSESREAFVSLYRARCLIAGAIAVERAASSGSTSIPHLQAVHQTLDSACLSYNVDMEPSESMAEGIRAGMRQLRDQPTPQVRPVEPGDTPYSERQLRSVLEHVAGTALTLDRVLMSAGTAEEGWDTNVLIDAAQQLSRQLGAMADSAIGGQVYGTSETWLYGPGFADLGKAGAA